MQIRKQRLTAAQQLVLDQLKFFDLHDEFGRAEYVLDLFGDRGAGRLVMRIIEADTCARAALNQDLMPRIDKFTSPRGHQTYAVFMNFDLFGYADFHTIAPRGSLRMARL